MLYLIDPTSIDLRGYGFDDWAKNYRSNLSQGLKLHLMIEGSKASPVFAQISQAQNSDIKIGREMPLESGATYVFDMGYYDFSWWHRIEQTGSVFVTRLKKNANVTSLKQQPIPAKSKMILEDAVIQMNNRRTGQCRIKNPYYTRPLRRVTVDRADKKSPLIVVTNDFERSADEIAALYKKRWGIELYFKWIKQNLKIKRFLGRSENAVRTQIFTALISGLLLQVYHQKQGIRTSLKLSLSTLRLNLFQRTRTDIEIAKRRRRQREYIDAIEPQLEFT